jgi:hypothetical protein
VVLAAAAAAGVSRPERRVLARCERRTPQFCGLPTCPAAPPRSACVLCAVCRECVHVLVKLCVGVHALLCCVGLAGVYGPLCGGFLGVVVLGSVVARLGLSQHEPNSSGYPPHDCPPPPGRYRRWSWMRSAWCLAVFKAGLASELPAPVVHSP